MGFPDINSIEPLADALGVSVLEIMRSEKIEEAIVTQDDASTALTDTFELVKLQRKAERKAIVKIVGCIAAVMLLLFFIDSVGWLGFAIAYFPVMCLLGSIILMICGIWRKKNKLPCLQTFVLAVAMLLVPVALAVIFFVAGALGLGPIPS